MKSKYDLTITQGMMRICTSKYEAVVLAAIAIEDECWTLGVSDKELSERTQRLVLPSEISKYLQMLIKKGFACVKLMITSEDRPAFSVLDVISYNDRSVTVIGNEFKTTILLNDKQSSDLMGCSFEINGATYKIHSRDICHCYEETEAAWLSKQKKDCALAEAI